MVYFSEIFDIDESLLEEYGALNISLLNDLPLFVDPFLLYASEKPEYQNLHYEIIRYLTFLRDKMLDGNITDEKIKRWYRFPEVKQVWLGYSEKGNSGAGLGSKFGRSMSEAIVHVYKDLNKETITNTSHLEKLGLFKSGVGRDNISDFTCNLIKRYLLQYTQEFAQTYLTANQRKRLSIEKVYFNYDLESWMPEVYELPYFNGDYIILTPIDILTKDENWINFSDMKARYFQIQHSIPNEEIRDRINDIYRSQIPRKKAKEEDYTRAINEIVKKCPEFMDYYILLKENDKEGAKRSSRRILTEAAQVYITNIQILIDKLLKGGFYNIKEPNDSYNETYQRILFFKDVLENQDGYKLLYTDGKPIKKEKDLQLLFKFTWFATAFDVNAEVNNGRGPVDYKVSLGNFDKTLIEFKLASNSKLKQNLENQLGIYEAANGTKKSLKVIFYFNYAEQNKIKRILKELKIENADNIILIDCSKNKPSASNAK